MDITAGSSSTLFKAPNSPSASPPYRYVIPLPAAYLYLLLDKAALSYLVMVLIQFAY